MLRVEVERVRTAPGARRVRALVCFRGGDVPCRLASTRSAERDARCRVLSGDRAERVPRAPRLRRVRRRWSIHRDESGCGREPEAQDRKCPTGAETLIDQAGAGRRVTRPVTPVWPEHARRRRLLKPLLIRNAHQQHDGRFAMLTPSAIARSLRMTAA